MMIQNPKRHTPKLHDVEAKSNIYNWLVVDLSIWLIVVNDG